MEKNENKNILKTLATLTFPALGGGNLLKQDYERISESVNFKINTTQDIQPQKIRRKSAFTLAEVGFSVGCSDSETRNIRSSVEGGKISERNLEPTQEQNSRIIRYKRAFTLAEVLITLGVIGIVAALTLPSLLHKINDKVVENQKKVMNGKIVQALNMLNSQENGLSKSYANSEEFVRALSKYMKMTTICGKNNMQDCLGYEDVNYYGGDCEEWGSGDCVVKNVKVSSLDAMKLRLGQNFLEPAAFVMGDGTPVIVSWNSKCASGSDSAIVLDPDQPLKTIPLQCFDGLYDLNGASRPNIYSKDVLAFGRAVVGTAYSNNEIPGIGVVINVGTVNRLLSNSEQKKYDPDYPWISYWASAQKICDDLDMKLPDINTFNTICAKKSQYPELFTAGSNSFWSSEETTVPYADSVSAAKVVFCSDSGHAYIEWANKFDSWNRAMCVSK